MKKFLCIISVIIFLCIEGSVYGQFIILGTGTSTNGTQTSSPVNIYYRRNVCQFVYTATELSAAGLSATDVINSIGWYVTQAPAYSIPDYTIKMKHVTVGDVAAALGTTGWTTVKNGFNYFPTAGGYDMISFDQNFTWNGSDNIGIELCWSQVQPNFDASGQCRIYSTNNGYRYSWTDDAGTSCGTTPNNPTSDKPQARIGYTPGLASDVGVENIPMGGFYNSGLTVTPTAVVKNYGYLPQSFTVTAVLSNGTTNVYTDTKSVSNLSPATTQNISFNPWTSVDGDYLITVTTQLSGDLNAINNEQTKSFSVGPYPIAFAGNVTDGTYNSINLANGNLTTLGTISMAPFPVAEEFNGSLYRLYGDFKFGTVDPDGTFSLAATLTGVSGSPTGLAWDWNTNTMYVIVLSSSQLPQLCTLNMSTYVLTLVGTGSEGRIMAMDFADDGYLYGPAINNDKLYRIDPANGEVTAIGDVGLNLNFGQDVSFDLITNQLYTITCGDESHFGIYDILTGAFTSIEDMDGDQYATFVITNPMGSGNNNDMMVYSTVPVESSCSSMGSESITITVKNNGYNPQTNVPVKYTINGGTPVNAVIPGTINPAGYANFTFPQTADFSAPGDYLVNICTMLSGDQYTANDCKSFTVTKLPHENPPYQMGFEPAEDFETWSMIDVNGGEHWRIQEYQQLAYEGDWLAMYESSNTLPGNDWLFSTCVELQASQTYTLTFWYSVGKRFGEVVPEKLKVAFGTEPVPSEMNDIIIDLGTINNANYLQQTSHFTVPATGIYFIGWHAYSNAGSFYIALDDIALDISQGISSVDADQISLYPNPASDLLYIQTRNPVLSVTFYNAMGQQVLELPVNADNNQVDVSSLPNGLYMLKVICDQSTYSTQVIIAR